MADESDDLLDAAEIEALLKSAGGAPGNAAPSPPSPPPQNPANSSAGELLGADEIEALLRSARVTTAEEPRSAGPAAEDLLRHAQAGVSAAASAASNFSRPSPAALSGAKPFQYEQFEPVSRDAAGLQMQALEEVELDLRIELGRAELLIEEVLKLREGSVVPLDKLAGDPVDILVNGRLVARGEVLVLNDNFCVRVAEILTPDVA